jgi:hypothetical protein
MRQARLRRETFAHDLENSGQQWLRTYPWFFIPVKEPFPGNADSDDGGHFGIVSWAGFGHVIAPQAGSRVGARVGQNAVAISC